MAKKVAIMGLSNTGKSFSRTYIEKGEECFVIAPSSKESYLTDSTGKSVDHMSLVNTKGQALTDDVKIIAMLEKTVTTNAKELDFKPQGNVLICPDVTKLRFILKFISDHMPHIKNIFIADFTHFISYILTTTAFRSKKSGGGAFEKYWDMAADSLTNVILSIDYLRKDLIVFTEYHTIFNSDDGIYDVFIPAGKMLAEKFMPKSYYDIVLYTHVLPYKGGQKESDRYKFVVVKKDEYDGRAANLFADSMEEGMIPNNLNLVITKIREQYGI